MHNLNIIFMYHKLYLCMKICIIISFFRVSRIRNYWFHHIFLSFLRFTFFLLNINKTDFEFYLSIPSSSLPDIKEKKNQKSTFYFQKVKAKQIFRGKLENLTWYVDHNGKLLPLFFNKTVLQGQECFASLSILCFVAEIK